MGDSALLAGEHIAAMRPPYCFQDSFPGESLRQGLQMPGRQMEALCQRITRERTPMRALSAMSVTAALLVQAAGSILAKAENAFLASLSRISVEDLARSTAPKLRKATK